MIKTIIVDDEPAIAEEMKNLLGAEEGLDIAGAYTEPLKALEAAEKIIPECAFLDIEMIGMSGIELAERLLSINSEMEIVFVTAYNHYATQAFEVNAVDYLLKPVQPARLKKTLDRLRRRREVYGEKNTGCTIRSFGGFEVYVGRHILKWNRSKTREVFAYLLQWCGKSISKYKLCDELWTGHFQEQALAYLQTSIWSIRKKLREVAFEGIHIEFSDDRYHVWLDRVEWDAAEFGKHYREYKKSGRLKDLEASLDYYSGEYMEGEDWLWAYADRESFRRMYEELVDKNKIAKSFER